MNDHDIRILFAEVLGYTNIWEPQETGPWDLDWSGLDSSLNRHWLPDPMRQDRDAAKLRAWCVEQNWEVVIHHRVAPAKGGRYLIVFITAVAESGAKREIGVGLSEDQDICRRERLAVCRAVLQAIEATEVEP